MRKQNNTTDKGGVAVAEAFAATVTETPAETIPEEPTTPPTFPVYRWEIPGKDGYSLLLDITDASDPEEARRAALSMQIGASEEDEGRELTAMESAWVKTYDPMIVKDTDTITLGHEWALLENAELKEENALYAKAKHAFETLGINPEDPMAWHNEQVKAVMAIQNGNRLEENKRRERLASLLTATMADLEAARQETGFAPLVPPAPPKPDYSILTVVAPEGTKYAYPELTDARWTEIDPTGDLEEKEVRGLHMIFNDNNGIVTEWLRERASIEEAEALESALARLKPFVGVA